MVLYLRSLCNVCYNSLKLRKGHMAEQQSTSGGKKVPDFRKDKGHSPHSLGPQTCFFQFPLQTIPHHSPSPPAGRQPEYFRTQPPPPSSTTSPGGSTAKDKDQACPITEPVTVRTEGTSSSNPPPALSRYMSLSLSHPGCGLQTDMNDGWRSCQSPSPH